MSTTGHMGSLVFIMALLHSSKMVETTLEKDMSNISDIDSLRKSTSTVWSSIMASNADKYFHP